MHTKQWVLESKWTIKQRGYDVGPVRGREEVHVGVDTPTRSYYDEAGLSTHCAVIT